jgi:hypothetical protein
VAVRIAFIYLFIYFVADMTDDFDDENSDLDEDDDEMMIRVMERKHQVFFCFFSPLSF